MPDPQHKPARIESRLIHFVMGIFLGVIMWMLCSGQPPPSSMLVPWAGSFEARFVFLLFLAGIITGILLGYSWILNVGVFCGLYGYWSWLSVGFPNDAAGPQIFPIIILTGLHVALGFLPACAIGGSARAWYKRQASNTV